MGRLKRLRDRGSTRPSATSESRQRMTCTRSSAESSRRESGQRRVGVAQAAQQLAAHLTVGPVPGLAAPGRSVVGRPTGDVPRAQVGDRALVAAWTSRHADESPELHHGDVPRVRGRAVGGHRVRGQPCLGPVEREVREGLALERAGQHTPDVGVDDDLGDAEGEARHRGGRVGTDPGKGQQPLGRVRHLAAVELDHHPCRLVQPEGPARVAEPSPGPHGISRRSGREVGRRRPPLHPLAPDRLDPRERRLLRHHLGEEDAPGAGSPAPATAGAGARTRRTTR